MQRCSYAHPRARACTRLSRRQTLLLEVLSTDSSWDKQATNLNIYSYTIRFGKKTFRMKTDFDFLNVFINILQKTYCRTHLKRSMLVIRSNFKVQMLIFKKLIAVGHVLSHVSRTAKVMEMFNNIRGKTVCKQEGHVMAQCNN